jgi:hypothetical protein
MDLRTWPALSARILELQKAEAERRAAAATKLRGERRYRSALSVADRRSSDGNS